MLKKAERFIVKHKRFLASAEPVIYKAFKQSNAQKAQHQNLVSVATLKRIGFFGLWLRPFGMIRIRFSAKSEARFRHIRVKRWYLNGKS